MAVPGGVFSVSGRWLGGLGAPGPVPAVGGYRSFWGFWLGGMGAPSSTPTPPTTPAVGWIGRFRHKPEDLERRLREQRDNTFSRRRFEEMLLEAAEQAAAEKNKTTRRVLKLAVREAKKIDVEAVSDFEPLTLALEAIATQAKEALAAAKQLIELAEAEKARLELEQDDEEAIWLLLN